MGGRRWRFNRSIGILLAALGWLSLFVGATSLTATAAPKSSKLQPLVPLPASCTTAPSLPPVSPTPAWPSGAGVLNAVEQAVPSQYPTVFAGMIVPRTPTRTGKTDFRVLETVHDTALEAEVRAAFPATITVSFGLASRSAVCLHDLAAQVTARRNAITKAGITMTSYGPDDVLNQVGVGVTACSASTERLAKAWFHQRWGSAVSVQTCQKVAQAFVGEAESG